MDELELTTKPDAAIALKRMEYWWEREVLDRPAIQVVAQKGDWRALPGFHHSTCREKALDVEYSVAQSLASIENTYWAGESLPIYWPNVGPEVLSTAYGCDLEFGEITSWSIPSLKNYDDVQSLRFNPNNIYVKSILEMTRLALQMGAGKFIVGITDLHPGADLAASLRDPQQLCLDLIDSPESVLALVNALRPSFFEFYTLQEKLIRASGQMLTTGWLPLYTEGRYYIPSCDFSAMISNRAFQRFFLPELLEEIAWLDRSIYHLDGPDAVRHLDTLLAIPKLDAIQYVPSPGSLPASRNMPLYQKIQAAGKNLHIRIKSTEMDTFMEALSPEGVMLDTWASCPEEADFLVAKTLKWRSK